MIDDKVEKTRKALTNLYMSIGLCHTAAILSRETEKALFYHPRPRSEKLGNEARQKKTKLL